MTYYGLVYGTVYGSLLVLTLLALRGLTSTLPALIGTLALYFSGEILNAQWEPHQEVASALFTLGFFMAWSGRRTAIALVCLALNAMVREDCGMLLALPLLLLTAHQAWAHRAAWRELSIRPRSLISLFDLRYPNTLGCAALSATLSVLCFEIKAHFFTGHDVVASFYYGDAFKHLTTELIQQRFDYYLHHAQYLWMPGVVLLAGAALLRDIRLSFGWIAYFPYWLFSFLSLGELNADMGAYKAFPLVLSLVWPAVMFRIAPESRRRALVWVQAFVLLAGCISYENGAVRFGAPFGIAGSAHRWLPRPEIQQAEAYRAFEVRLEHVGDLGRVRASQGVLALYPYAFDRWDSSSLTDEGIERAADLDSLIWFEGDRDASRIETVVTKAQLAHRYRVNGTKMWLATRLPPARLTAFDGAIEVLADSTPNPQEMPVLRADVPEPTGNTQ
jgi:hypothetical protein